MQKIADYALETLLDLDGYIAELGEGYWVKIEARRTTIDEQKPHGIKYSLTLHDLKGTRILGYDNAHSVSSRRSLKAHDHIHKSGRVISYIYKDAVQLLDDFWKDVDRILERKR
jgi:uncharacterized protein DUF6516